jgi:hypothetical protein
LFSDGQISSLRIDPAARIVVVNSFFLAVHDFMGVTAEDAARVVQSSVIQGAASHLRRHAKPPRVQAIDQAGQGLSLEIKLLQLEVKQGPEMAEF